jgi:RNA polymerase sigma-70 factor (ECF subfamily)
MHCSLQERPGTPAPCARPSFETIYNLGLPFVRQALRWLGVAEHDLDDLLQEVMLAAYRALDRYDPDRTALFSPATMNTDPHRAGARCPSSSQPLLDALRRWLFGITWRQVSHYKNRAHRRREIPLGAGASWPLHPADPTPSSEQLLLRDQQSRLVCRLLSTLDFDRRVVLILYDLLDVPIAEIAGELELKESTVRSRLRLAREDFRLAVKRLRAEERRALRTAGHLAASEPVRGLEPDALLRAARAIPDVPDHLRRALWVAMQRAIAAEPTSAQWESILA